MLALALALAGCATAPTTATSKGGPRGLRASEHLDAAHQQDEMARHDAMWPDVVHGTPADLPVTVPWVRSWDASSDHGRLADIHRSKAAELHAAYEQACGDRPQADVAVSPLVRYGVGGWMTQTGAIVYLSKDAGAPDALLSALACHRAWMMLAPTNMDDCPLDLPGLVIDARGDADGITVSIGVKDNALVPELQRRVAIDLEAGSHAAHAPTRATR